MSEYFSWTIAGIITGFGILLFVIGCLANALERSKNAAEEWKRAAKRNQERAEQNKAEADEAKRIIRKMSLRK